MHLNFKYLSLNSNACYLAIILVILSTLYYIIRSRKLPPGPVGLPYIGYWPFFDNSTIHMQLRELSKRFGDIFCFTVTGHLYIALCSFSAIREVVLKKTQDFEGRTENFNLLKFFFEGEDRKGPIYEAVRDCVKDLEKVAGQPMDITEVIVKGSNNILRTTLFAGEEDITDKDVNDVCHSYGFMLENMTGPNLLLIGDIAKYFIHPFTKGKGLAVKHRKVMQKNIYSMIKRRKSSFNENNARNDIFDRYFKERLDRLSRNDPTAQHFTDKALMGAIFQCIGDGVLTVAVFVSAFFKALLDYPEEQEKIYEELMDVVGADRDPGMEDKSRLPYTNAFILEVIRISEVFPFIPELECTRETTIQGYRIPKGSVMLVNTWVDHHDPKEYEEPNKFNPSRYIPAKGKKKPEAPILFGIGKRSCIGEGYAMAQTFIFLTTIIKHFRLTKATEEENQLLFNVGKLEVLAIPRTSLI